VYDFNYEDIGYPATSAGYPPITAYSDSHDAMPSGPRWVEGYSTSEQAALNNSGLKLRVSNRQIIGFVTASTWYFI